MKPRPYSDHTTAPIAMKPRPYSDHATAPIAMKPRPYSDYARSTMKREQPRFFTKRGCSLFLHIATHIYITSYKCVCLCCHVIPLFQTYQSRRQV